MEHGEEVQLIEAIANGLTAGDVAYWADSFIMVAVLRFALEPFEQLLSSKDRQLPRTFQVRAPWI